MANTPPVAEAGADRSALVGVPVALDGTGSTDADGDVLAYLWDFVSRPAGSRAVLSNPTSAAAGFTPDVEGSYVVRLLVDDGRTAVASDNVTVTVNFDTSPVFGAAIAIPTGSSPKAVAIGDLNGDGRNDVAMTTWYGPDAANDFKLFVFLQGSDGRLLPPVKYPTRGSYVASPESVVIGDVAGNGRNAVVVGLSRSGIEVFPCDNEGTLGASSFHATANSRNVRIADLNHDGRMDIAGIGWGTGSVDVLYQDSSGALLPPVTHPVTHGGREDLEVGDVNGDGRADIVVMSGQSLLPNIGVLYQQAAGGFSAASYSSVGPASALTLTHGVAVGDVTGDGRADVAVSYGGNSPSGRIGIFSQDNTGSLGAAVPHASYDIPGPVEIADVNGDGRMDVLVLHDAWSSLGVYLQKPDGSLTEELRHPVPYAGYGPHGLAAGDVDGDGRLDIVIADAGHGLVVLSNIR